ncbi:chitin deacetylase 1-like isoform X27 [Scylla paramamosain]|uniref:chitin deacetylase 1-like isoform X27 n=1 Tax=Scylla paramamosain TaxID=85552 RepID=UPI003082AEFE
MGWTTSLLLLSLLGLSACQQRSLRNTGNGRQRLQSGKPAEVADFNCPQDFGYYPHPTDCTQYYVCVFGGALQESCTGGLVYSHELETCDWPRNVDCAPGATGGGVSTIIVTDPRTRSSNTRPISPVTESLTPSVGSFDKFDHSFSSTKNHRTTQTLNGADRSGNERALFRQPSSKSQFLSSHFSSSSFFNAPGTGGTNNRRPTKSASFTPSPVVVSHGPSAPARLPSSVDQTYFSDFNYTDPDYYFYYDDLLYDYYDVPGATPTQAPARHPAPTQPAIRIPSRPSSSSTRSSSSSNSRPQPTPSGPPAVDNSQPKRPTPTRPHPTPDTKATKCDPKVCRLPDCYCGGGDIPGGFSAAETPQLVLLTFDDSVNDLNKDLYTDLFEKGRLNPNGCPILSTMYVSHEWTDYSQVQNLYAEGHEIASHSITHSFGEQFSTTKWAKEIAGQREILSAYGGVKMEDVRGMRAPFLAVGGNKMYRMLYEQNFTYDSSMPVYENNPPSWPYTLDYRLFHDCMIPPCPTNSFPGLWQVPMVMWQDLKGGRCSMGDACTTPPDAEGVYKMLIKNFERHYTTNRAPFGLFYHAAWFTTPHHKEGFIAFLDTITAMDDVWLVTNWQALQWVRDPTPLSRVKSFGPFQCNYSDRPKCTTKKVCNVWHKGGVRYMRTCQKCPDEYPWTGNTGVKSPLNDLP